MSAIPDRVERALELSRADDCIVIAARSSTANIRWANNTSTTNGATESEDFIVLSVIGDRVGTVARNHVTDDTLEDLVRASEAACEHVPPAADRMPLLPGDGSAPGDWGDPPAETSVRTLGGFAQGLADAFARGRSDGIELFGYAEHETETVWLATSSGIRRRYTDAKGRVEITGKTPDFARSTWAGQLTRTFTDVELERLYAKLAQGLAWSERRIELPAGRYEVLLEPTATADLLLYQFVSMSRREADEGRTVFSKPGGGNRIGEKMMSDQVTLYSDPAEPVVEVPSLVLAPASSSYSSVFDNGLEAGRSTWVREGALESLITTRHWAEKTGSPGPVPFVANLVMPSDGPSLEDMIARTERALLITSLWYIREVDPQTLLLTGLTRDGVYLVENGEVAGAVNNFRWNVSPVKALADVAEVGRSEPVLSREWEFALTKVPPLRVPDFNMSSVSEAT